jgi:hypothetical protein
MVLLILPHLAFSALTVSDNCPGVDGVTWSPACDIIEDDRRILQRRIDHLVERIGGHRAAKDCEPGGRFKRR